jgi:hypothetical protein
MQEPDIVKRDAQAYYQWLRSQRISGAQAYQMVIQRFGEPKSQGDLAAERQKAAENASLAQAGGAVAGTLGTAYLYNQLTTPSNPQIPPTTQPQLQGGGSLTINRPVPPPTATVDGSGATVDLGGTTPKVISTQGEMSTVQTPTGVQTVPTESLNDPGFWSNVNWDQVAQGGLGLAQMYMGYRSFKDGDKIGGGLGMASGAANVAASGWAGAGAQSAAQSGAGAYVIPGLNLAMGAYGAYKTAEMTGEMAAGKQRDVGAAQSGAMAGAAIGSVIPGLGTVAGAAIGALAGYAGSKFAGSSKKKPQVMRDNIRQVLQQNNILDENFQGTLADGTKTDFGQDGSKLNTKAMMKLSEEQPAAYETAKQLGDAIAASYGFVGTKASSLARMYVRSALANANNDPKIAMANMQHFAKQQGIGFDQLKTSLDQAKADNRISDNQYNSLLTYSQQLTGASASPLNVVAPIARPEKGEVGRQSAGLYRDDQGKLIRASSRRQALETAYSKTKEKEKK